MIGKAVRLGELQAVTWNDFSHDKLSINKSLTYKTSKGAYEIKEPKTVSGIREISLGNTLSKYLMNLKESEMKKAGFNEN